MSQHALTAGLQTLQKGPLRQTGARQGGDCIPHQSGTVHGRSYLSPIRLFCASPTP